MFGLTSLTCHSCHISCESTKIENDKTTRTSWWGQMTKKAWGLLDQQQLCWYEKTRDAFFISISSLSMACSHPAMLDHMTPMNAFWQVAADQLSIDVSLKNHMRFQLKHPVWWPNFHFKIIGVQFIHRIIFVSDSEVTAGTVKWTWCCPPPPPGHSHPRAARPPCWALGRVGCRVGATPPSPFHPLAFRPRCHRRAPSRTLSQTSSPSGKCSGRVFLSLLYFSRWKYKISRKRDFLNSARTMSWAPF